MKNLRPERTEDQYIIPPSVEALERNFYVRRSERIRKSPQWYNPWFGADGEWKNDAVASIVYIIQDRDFNINVDAHNILLLLAEWDVEDCMDMPSTFHMRESYFLKNKSHNTDTPTYMESLSGENAEEYFKAMDDEVSWEGTHGRLF